MTEIISQTPKWVFFVLFILLYFGYVQSKPREVTKKRLVIIPVAMTGLSLYSVWSAFGATTLGFSAWIVGIAVAQLINSVLRQPTGVDYVRLKGHFVIPGSYVPLTLMMAIFFTKYFISAAIAVKFMSPEVQAFVGGTSFALGLFSGTFIARAFHMWKMGSTD